MGEGRKYKRFLYHPDSGVPDCSSNMLGHKNCFNVVMHTQ